MPSRVEASHSPRRRWRRWRWWSAWLGSATRPRWPMTWRRRGGSRRRAASTRTGSASVVSWSGSGGCRGPGRWHGPATAPRRPGRCGPGAAEQGPGGPHPAVGHPCPYPQPLTEPAGGGAGLDPLLGPGGPAGVQVGQLGQPVAVQPVQQPPQLKDPLGPDRVRASVQVLGGQVLDRRGQGGQPVWSPGRVPVRRAIRICVRGHGRQPINPTPEHKHLIAIGGQPRWPSGRLRFPTRTGAWNRAVVPPLSVEGTLVPGAWVREASIEPGECTRSLGRAPCRLDPWSPRTLSTKPAAFLSRTTPTHRARQLHEARTTPSHRAR